jgi:hypothetical protein
MKMAVIMRVSAHDIAPALEARHARERAASLFIGSHMPAQLDSSQPAKIVTKEYWIPFTV